MLLPNPIVPTEAVSGAVEKYFGFRPCEIAFRPWGEDSWNYICDDLVVSFRNDVKGHHAVAYEWATRASESGLDFVLAPVRGIDGEVVHEVCGLPMVASRFTEGEFLRRDIIEKHRNACLEVMTKVWEESPLFDLDLPQENLVFPFADKIEAAWYRADSDLPLAGPYDAVFRKRILRSVDKVSAWHDELKMLASSLKSDCEFVLTHGDPAAHNWLLVGGRPVLLDWGGALLSPRERDHYHLTTSLGMTYPPTPAYRYYDLLWRLSEIAEYAAAFAEPHGDDLDSSAKWRRACKFLDLCD